MQVTLIFAALLSCSYARFALPRGYGARYPEYIKYPKIKRVNARDLTWETNAGRENLFGTRGSTDVSLFSEGGYKQDIFSDHRARQGQAYASRVLSPYGVSTAMDGNLDWSNENSRMGGNLHREIGGQRGLSQAGEDGWKLDNTRFVTAGNLHKTLGHEEPEFLVQNRIEHDF